jgi:hypothetical protein
MVYNSEYLLPESCEEIKKTSKMIFFLGDSPFYTPLNNYYLQILSYADLILAPDTFWLSQLNTIGYRQTHFIVPGIDCTSYHQEPDPELLRQVPESEVLYVGMCYIGSWGYKKALFLNHFADFDLKIFGSKHWKKWFENFPLLRDTFVESPFIPVNRLNAMMNRTRIVPVDGNPGIFNGFHLRMLEALGAGALSIVEYRRDVDNEVFGKAIKMVPLIRNYNEVKQVVAYYLAHEDERRQLAAYLKEYIQREYSPEMNSMRIMDWLQ